MTISSHSWVRLRLTARQPIRESSSVQSIKDERPVDVQRVLPGYPLELLS